MFLFLAVAGWLAFMAGVFLAVLLVVIGWLARAVWWLVTLPFRPVKWFTTQGSA